MDALFVRRAGLPEAALGPDSLALLDLGKGRYYGLDGSGLRIWQLIETPTSLDAVSECLQQEFEVDAEVCRREVEAFVTRLVSEGLAERVPAATPAS